MSSKKKKIDRDISHSSRVGIVFSIDQKRKGGQLIHNQLYFRTCYTRIPNWNRFSIATGSYKIVCFYQFVSSPMFYAFTCIGLLFKALQQRYKRYYTTHVLENINNKQYELEEQKRMFSNLDPSLSSCASLVSQATHTFINPYNCALQTCIS
jgi:hypothetical protein